jgi:hypothetical protein
MAGTSTEPFCKRELSQCIPKPSFDKVDSIGTAASVIETRSFATHVEAHGLLKDTPPFLQVVGHLGIQKH